MRTAVLLALAVLVSIALAADSPQPKSSDVAALGVLPVGADGKPLNLDFETGTLKDWTATGDAFVSQPINGDTVSKRRSDMKSQHRGNYWIGTFETAGDKPKGTLTSVPFKVTHAYASFLIAGGSQAEERVEIVRADDQSVIFKSTGNDTENLQPVVVDLREQIGKEIFIRLVDDRSDGWGHLNFDDFKFYSEEPKFPDQLKRPVLPPVDIVKNAGLKPEDSVKAMTLPPGFSATVFAAEPDLVQPVALCIDDRGRIWVAEAMTYPRRAPEGQGKDRILIFEDTDGDGKFDKKTVFMEGLNLVSGLEVGFGGVWVGAAPYLLFIPDKNHDDIPDGPPQIVLDGWHYEDTHETLNAFNWGPDGWLYGCHGVFTYSRVGKPGTPDAQRTPINAGVWRYHPTKQIFEVFAEGTSNPWGVDFNDQGQAFITACVIPHLFHMIQGGRYQRQGGQHFNPYIYQDITTIADHVHWAGGGAPHAANGRSDATGGGHAHCGAMIYLGDSFPAQYRNSIFMANIHGNRINNDILEAKGSGYVGHHGADFMFANDKWSRLINMKYGPDGSVYLIDWYDVQPCHLNKPEVWDRTNGRLYKIVYNNTKAASVDLAKLSDDELAKLQTHPNDWYVRHARRLLQERNSGQAALASALNNETDPVKHLRYLWSLHVTGGVTDAVILNELKNANEYVRAWAIQLAAEDRKVSPEILTECARLATADPSPVVRLYLASAMQRLPLEQRWDTLKGLVAHAEDAGDHNLPLLLWYAFEPLAAKEPSRALKMVAESKLPRLREFTARRIASASQRK